MGPVAASVSYLGDERAKLVTALAGDEFTTAPNVDAIKALPAIVVEPSRASWLDGAVDSGPGRVVRFSIEALVVVNAQEPIGALVDLEDHVELVLERLPKAWRFDRAEAPVPERTRNGEIQALRSTLTLSMRYSIT
jgi:hypothetical protein